jgi:hypothetical protein
MNKVFKIVVIKKQLIIALNGKSIKKSISPCAECHSTGKRSKMFIGNIITLSKMFAKNSAIKCPLSYVSESCTA